MCFFLLVKFYLIIFELSTTPVNEPLSANVNQLLSGDMRTFVDFHDLVVGLIDRNIHAFAELDN